MVFNLGYAQTLNQNDNEKYRQIAGNFGCHAAAAVQRGVHPPMKHNPGFTQNHWVPPLVKCMRRIASAAAMVEEFVENTQNSNKHNF
jgi:hypothetical protein